MSEETKPQEIVEEKIKDLDPRFIRQIENAEKSIDKNPAYTVDICCTILNKHPSCAEVRKILRQAQIKKCKVNPISKFIADINGFFFALKAAKKVSAGQALEVLNDAEVQLKACPVCVSVLRAQALAAESLQYWGTAATAYQAIAQIQPKNDKNLIALGNALVKNRQPDEAMQVCDIILSRNPANGDAQALSRSAQVVKSEEQGKWNEEKSAREKVKDAQATLDREKETSTTNDEETLNRFVERLKAQIAKDPENINFYRDICSNLRALKRYSEALEYVRLARQQPLGKGDTTFEKMEQDFTVAAMEQRIAALEKEIAETPDAAKSEELAKLKKEEHDFKLQNTKVMVERYPNDFNYRFILGQLLFEDNLLDDAIMQFQISQRNPKVRLQSLMYLGRAFTMGKKYDLAVDQLQAAKKEAKIMNDTKKDIIYNLATAYELMGKDDLAFNEFKEIYSSDISYKDVAKKINDFYAKKNA